MSLDKREPQLKEVAPFPVGNHVVNQFVGNMLLGVPQMRDYLIDTIGAEMLSENSTLAGYQVLFPMSTGATGDDTQMFEYGFFGAYGMLLASARSKRGFLARLQPADMNDYFDAIVNQGGLEVTSDYIVNRMNNIKRFERHLAYGIGELSKVLTQTDQSRRVLQGATFVTGAFQYHYGRSLI
jgi:hypothetical protein